MISFMGKEWYDLTELEREYGRCRSVILRCIKHKLKVEGPEILSVAYGVVHGDKSLRGGKIKIVSKAAKAELDKYFPPSGYVTLRDASLTLGCSYKRLRAFSGDGKIPCKDFKDSVIYKKDDIEKIKNSGLIKGIHTQWGDVIALFTKQG